MARYRRQPRYYDDSPGLFDRPYSSNASASERPNEGFRPMELSTSDDRLRFLSFGSGSSGNCAYIGDSRMGFLVDAGVDPTRVQETLERNGIAMSAVKAIILTHDHSDHVRYAYTLLRKQRHMRVYCTPRVLNGLLRRHSISRRIADYHEVIHKEFPFSIGAFTITAFEVSHDGSDNAGFFIEHGVHKFAVATDLGVIGERGRHYMSQARYLMIESNYDAAMLVGGRYPEYLKARIMADSGHLDNVDTAAFVADVAARGALKYVFLCHLSNDNNTPAIAVATVKGAVEAKGLTVGDCSDSLDTRDADLQLMALPRFDATRLFIFRP